MAVDVQAFSTRFPQIVSPLHDANLRALVAAFREEALMDGAAAVAQGSPVAALTLLSEGTLVVTAANIEIGTVGPGALVGEVAWIDRGAATASLTARGPVSLLRLERAAWEGLRRENPIAAAHLLRMINRSIAQRLRASDARFEALTTAAPPAERRLGLFDSFFALFSAPGA